MKKLLYLILLLFTVIIVLPFFIVKSCNYILPEKEQGLNSGLRIKVYVKSAGKTVEAPLEAFIVGAVAAEMPASFEMEALKAQAVAARTYVYARFKKLYVSKDNPHPDADVCTDFAHCMAWVSKKEAMKRWNIFYARYYWNRVVTAVKETEGLILTYDNKPINAMFHSNSGGRTENVEDVFGASEPYLRSVASPGEEDSKEYINVVKIGKSDFIARMKGQFGDFSINRKNMMDSIDILSHTEGGRVKDIKIGGIIIKGTDVRRIFGLKSANFSIKEDGDSVVFTTLGYGHGVGMSQWGANSMARSGGDFEEILKLYYTGVELSRIY